MTRQRLHGSEILPGLVVRTPRPDRHELPAHRTGPQAEATRAVIVAVDLSITSTGITWLDEDGRIGAHTVKTVPLPDPMRCGWGPSIRRTRVAVALKRVLRPGCLLVREERLSTLNVKGNSALDIAALHATIEDVAQMRDVPIASVNVGRVKIYGSGTGRADKDQQVAAAARELGDVVQLFNDDEADSVWALAIGSHIAGLPLVRITKRRLEVVGQCIPGWPDDSTWHKSKMPAGLQTRRATT